METVRFLRDIEDETKYAQGLEFVYVEARDYLTDLANKMRHDSDELKLMQCYEPFQDRLKELDHIIFTMSLVIRDCVDRRKRLANIAAGLPNVVFDEESP